MGLFEKIFGKAPKPRGDYKGDFKLLTGYEPHFTTWRGSIYENELIRAAIEARATHVGKLKVEVFGSAKPALQAKLKRGPNEYQTWEQFLRRLETLRCVYNTAFITPVFDRYGEVSGIYAPLPERCTIVEYGDTPYLRYEFARGQTAAVELENCGIVNRFAYRSDFFGENNAALDPTLALTHIQNQGIREGVKSAASYRFMARYSAFTKDSDLSKERQRFSEENFAQDANGGGVLLFPNTYQDIKQIDSKPWVIDADQMRVIRDGVFEYFTVNEDILTGAAYGDKWSAFYESVIESAAIQISEVLTKMLFTFYEQGRGNFVQLTANRLQYMSNKDKLDVSAQLLDRGMLTLNEAREIWNLPPVEGGDERIIRGEYYNADEKVEGGGES